MPREALQPVLLRATLPPMTAPWASQRQQAAPTASQQGLQLPRQQRRLAPQAWQLRVTQPKRKPTARRALAQ